MERVVVSTAAVSLDTGCCCPHGDALGDQILVVMQDVVAGHGRGYAGHPDILDREPSFGPVRVARRNANERPIPSGGLLAEAVQYL
jgi:hypothetical protein